MAYKEYCPGELALAWGHYEGLNVFGARTGEMIFVN